MASYKKMPLSFGRRMVAASASVTKDKNAIHCISEVDITKPRDLIKSISKKQEKNFHWQHTLWHVFQMLLKIILNLTHLSKAKTNIAWWYYNKRINWTWNRWRKSPWTNRDSESTVQDISSNAQGNKRSQNQQTDKLGSLSGKIWINLIPSFFLRLMIRIADKNIYMAKSMERLLLQLLECIAKNQFGVFHMVQQLYYWQLGVLTRKSLN